jgi:hypothetical protein
MTNPPVLMPPPGYPAGRAILIAALLATLLAAIIALALSPATGALLDPAPTPTVGIGP